MIVGYTDMFAKALATLFDYHFAENRAMWETYILPLTDEQFTQDFNYSHGSIRNQIVHLISVDDTWFSPLRGLDVPEPLDPATLTSRDQIRQRWDLVEESMRGYLADLSEEILFSRPFPEGEDEDLFTWQVMMQVINHGTDHRAQIRCALHDLGVKTMSQDYIFYAYEFPWEPGSD